VSSGLAPAGRAAASNLFVLHSDEQLLRALESKQYGRPLALGAVIREALAAKDLIPLREFLDAKESIYRRPWSVWNLAAWTMKQLGVADMLKNDSLPPGQFVVVANVEEAGKTFADLNGATSTTQSRFERTFSKAHFFRTFNDQLIDGKHLSETDLEVLLRFLSRDKGAILYDGTTVKIKNPGIPDPSDTITPEDASIAQLKELLHSLTHQTSLLSHRIDVLAAQAKQAVAKNNRVAALAALRSKKLAESTLERRFATVSQLEEVASKIEQAADNVQLVAVMESSGAALKSLHAQTGGAERVGEVVDRLREQMAAVDEVGSILAEEAGVVVVDEEEIDDELEAMEGEERRKVEEAEREKREERERREAEELRQRLEAAGEVPAGAVVEGGKEGEQDSSLQAAEDLMSRMSLKETPERQDA
jgi:charged multivesicular body protein 7